MPYVGEIRMLGFNFAPVGWALCNGQLLPISENDVLFQLIGTTYGGDGEETFGLPDLQGRIPVHMGTSPSTGTSYQLGEKAGTESVTLTVQQMAAHNHPLLASTNVATTNAAADNIPASMIAAGTASAYGNDPPTRALDPSSVTPAGGSQPHTNMQPFLCVTFAISLFGVFPPPN
jgi:microcystin-dependent protein